MINQISIFFSNFLKKQKENYYFVFAFCILCLSFILISYLVGHYIITDRIYHQSVREQLSEIRAIEVMKNRFKYEWLNLVITPMLNALAFLLTSIVIMTGVFLKSYRIPFIKILTVVIYANFVFLIPSVIRLAYFSFTETNFTFEQFRNFYPYSLLYFIDKENISEWFYYPIYLVNIFELLYFVLLAIGTCIISHLSFIKSFFLVLQTYGIALLLWVVFMIFLSITLN